MKHLFRSLHDSRIYLLVIPATLLLFLIDPILTKTWMQFGLVLLILAGLTLFLRKVLFNTFDMSAAIDKAVETSGGAAQVVVAVSIVMAAVMVSATLWLAH